jgi:outer membrane protein
MTVLDTTVINGQTAVDAVDVPVAIDTSDEQDVGPRKSLYLSADMALFDLSNWYDYFAARAGHARGRLDVLASEQDLIYSVKVAYYAYLAAEENVAVQEEAVKRAEEQLKLIESRFDLGSASLSDVLKQKVQYGNDRLGLLRARNAVVETKATLAYTIGLDPRQEHEFSTDYTVREYEGTLEEAIGFGLAHNPSLLGQEQTYSQALNRVRSANSLYLPTLSVFADYNKFNGTQAYPVAFDYSSDSYTYGFVIRYGLFDGFLREKRVTDAKVIRNNARADLADARNLTVSRIKTAYLEIEQLKEQKAVSGENVNAAEEDLKITQEKYNLGAATILDLLDAQVSMKQAQVALIQADFDLNLAVAKLENAMGKM